MVSFGVGWLYSRKKPLSAIVHQLQMWFILLCYYLLLFIMLLFCINYFCQTAHSCMHRNLVQPWIHLQRGMKEEWKKMRDVEMSSKETQAWGKLKPFSGFPFIAKQHLVGCVSSPTCVNIVICCGYLCTSLASSWESSKRVWWDSGQEWSWDNYKWRQINWVRLSSRVLFCKE